MAGGGELEEERLHVVFLPLLAHGHMLPLFDIARLFAAAGVKSTLITTPANAPFFSSSSSSVHLETLPFPGEQVGLPAGIENFEHINNDADLDKFARGVELLAAPLKHLLERLHRPLCLVSDRFMPWTADVAAELGIPRVVFHGCGYFGRSVADAMRIQLPVAMEGGEEEIVVAGVPGEVRMAMKKVSPQWKEAAEGRESAMMKMAREGFEAEGRSYGVIMNSFDELEPDYADYYRRVVLAGRRAWSIGPVSLSNRNIVEKATRGKKADIDEHACLYWLDSKPPNSVIYVCFGSITHMPTAQLREIAAALEASTHHFIWVIRRPNDTIYSADRAAEDKKWLPDGFETRTKERGLVIRGWAPQVMILDHGATGGFVTHCGWNSTLEGISAGKPMVTWPGFAEQFINEKLITEVLRVGVPVGVKEHWDRQAEGAGVGRESVEAAVRRVMVGEEAEEMRMRVGELKEKAWKAVEEGGSSSKGLGDLLEELRSFGVAN